MGGIFWYYYHPHPKRFLKFFIICSKNRHFSLASNMNQPFLQIIWEHLNCPWCSCPYRTEPLQNSKVLKQTYENSPQYLIRMMRPVRSLLTGLRITSGRYQGLQIAGEGLGVIMVPPVGQRCSLEGGDCFSTRPWQAVLRHQPETPSLLHHYQQKYPVVFSPWADVWTNRRAWPVKMTVHIDSSYLDVFGKTAYLKFTKEGTLNQCFFINKWQWQPSL